MDGRERVVLAVLSREPDATEAWRSKSGEGTPLEDRVKTLLAHVMLTRYQFLFFSSIVNSLFLQILKAHIFDGKQSTELTKAIKVSIEEILKQFDGLCRILSFVYRLIVLICVGDLKKSIRRIRKRRRLQDAMSPKKFTKTIGAPKAGSSSSAAMKGQISLHCANSVVKLNLLLLCQQDILTLCTLCFVCAVRTCLCVVLCCDVFVYVCPFVNVISLCHCKFSPLKGYGIIQDHSRFSFFFSSTAVNAR